MGGNSRLILIPTLFLHFETCLCPTAGFSVEEIIVATKGFMLQYLAPSGGHNVLLC